jgi:predicted HicB family RNase H-like nuclease
MARNEFAKEQLFHIDKTTELCYTVSMQEPLDTRSRQLNIRYFPDDLKQRIMASAKQNRRSMSQEIIYGLERYLETVKENGQK